MQNLSDLKRSIEPWYLLMVVLGALNVAFNIMLIPQHIADSYPDGNALIGIVMSAWTAGPLLSPLMSKYMRLTEGRQYNVAKLFLLNAVLAFSVPYCTHVSLLFLNLLIQGLIYAGIYSILNLLIVKRFEESQWHNRTSMLVAAFIIGEVIGFALAGVMTDPIRGVSLGGVGLLITSIFCLRVLPTYHADNAAGNQNQGPVSGQTKALLLSPFGLMVLGWALLCFSAQIMFLPFPVLMEDVFLLPPLQSSMALSVAGLIALGFYPFIGSLTTRYGADNVLISASAVKVLVFVAFSFCAISMTDALIPFAMLLIALNRWTWPFMMTGAQIQASTLSKGRGNTLALTLFMAFSGAGNMLAGVMNSYVTAQLGIEYVPMFAAAACFLGVVLVIGSKLYPFRVSTRSLTSKGLLNEKG